MTDETPLPEKPEESKSSTGRKAAIGAAATIGSAAIAAALLYAGKRFRQKGENKAPPGVPSGEPPETD